MDMNTDRSFKLNTFLKVLHIILYYIIPAGKVRTK